MLPRFPRALFNNRQLGKHIWTYVGLAAPLLGAPGPLRSVLSGENMGLPFTDEEARGLELCEFTLLCNGAVPFYFILRF